MHMQEVNDGPFTIACKLSKVINYFSKVARKIETKMCVCTCLHACVHVHKNSKFVQLN